MFQNFEKPARDFWYETLKGIGGDLREFFLDTRSGFETEVPGSDTHEEYTS